MKKHRLKILLYTSLTLFSWMIVGLGAASQSNAKVKSLQPVILNEENNHFLDMDDVRSLVRDIQERPLEECKRKEVKIDKIERSLEYNPYVKQAEAYTDVDGNVVVEVELRKPLARVMYDDGSGFYVDQEFERVDLTSKYSANTPIIRGLPQSELAPEEVAEGEHLKGMRDFLRYVNGSELLRNQVSEIVVKPNGELVLYPEMGDVVVEFGKPEDIDRKFKKMEIFYRRVLTFSGWKAYRRISLKYEGQVVASR